AVLCSRTISFSLLQSAIASGLVDARRVILIGDLNQCLHFSAQAMAPGVRTICSFEFPAVRAYCSVPARPAAVQLRPDARQLVADCRPDGVLECLLRRVRLQHFCSPPFHLANRGAYWTWAAIARTHRIISFSRPWRCNC